MYLRFIGDDTGTRLLKGSIYKCEIRTMNNLVWVSWIYGAEDKFGDYCPYSSIRKMLENWEEV